MAADGPCLVTADQVGEITGTSQEIREVELPEGLGADLTCETVVHERDVSLKWSLREPFIDPPPTHEEQRSFVPNPGLTIEEADLGGGQNGWIGAGKTGGLPRARVFAIVDELALEVNVTSTDRDATLEVDDVADEALQLARAIVVAGRG